MPAPPLRGGPCPPALAVHFFPNVFDRRAVPRTLSWDALASRLRDFPVRDDIHDKRLLPCWAPAELDGRRVVAVTAVVLDVDDGATIAAAHDASGPFTVALHTSSRHTPEAPRFRLVLPLSQPVPGDRWTEAWRLAVDALGLHIDRSCANANRRYLLPARPRRDAPTHAEVPTTDQALDLLPLLPPATEAQHPPHPARRPVVVPARHLDRAVRRRLAWDPAARARLADRLGAALHGEGRTQRADGIPCPACGRPSAWFLLAPERATRARCKHHHSCGWTGPLTELCGRAA